jgi:hypothetical protein
LPERLPEFDNSGSISKPPRIEPLKVQKRRLTMNDMESLNHTVWDCKYHMVWISKYRKKVLGSSQEFVGQLWHR